MRFYGHTSRPYLAPKHELFTKNVVVAYLKVTGTDTSPTFPVKDLSYFNPWRPPYLKNLLNIQNYEDMKYKDPKNPYGTPLTYFEAIINPINISNVPFTSPNDYLANFTLGQRSLWRVINANMHSFHIHVNV